MTTTENHDATLDAALAQALGTDAQDTALLSRAVLTRLAEDRHPPRPALAEVLTDPLPATGLMLAALLMAGLAGYALVPASLQDAMAAYVLAMQGL
jgi:hypothetical protein